MIVWESRDEQELQDIYDYIFFNSPQNAENVTTELVSIAESTATEPYFLFMAIQFYENTC